MLRLLQSVGSVHCVQARHLHQAIPTVVGKHRGRQQRAVVEEVEEEVATAMVNHLERLSLVDFADLKGIARLGEAVKLAGAVVDVDTKGFRYLSRSLLRDVFFSSQQTSRRLISFEVILLHLCPVSAAICERRICQFIT